MDLGVALGSAAKMAMDLNADNRLMFAVGTAARAQGLIEADLVIGIPLSIGGKNPFFDRIPSRSPLAKPGEKGPSGVPPASAPGTTR